MKVLDIRYMQKDNTLMNLQDVIADVKTFCDSYKIEVSENPTTDLSRDAIFLRHRLMEEENNEYLEAAEAGDLVEIADALGDQLYILCGTILSHGMQHVIEDVFAEIQSSNMSKLGEDGEPIVREDGKILKGPHYFKPDIKSILESHSAHEDITANV
jgi:predicted HAD superfamily Cof-like phosphohydrolase